MRVGVEVVREAAQLLKDRLLVLCERNVGDAARGRAEDGAVLGGASAVGETGGKGGRAKAQLADVHRVEVRGAQHCASHRGTVEHLGEDRGRARAGVRAGVSH